MVSLKTFAIATSVLSTVNSLSLIPAIGANLQSVTNLFEDVDIKEPSIILTFPNPNPNEKPIPGNSPIVQCDALESQILSLQSVIIDPNPPARGENLTFVAKGWLSKDIVDGAYVEVDVRYGFIKLIHQTFDLCEEIGKVDLECPILEGEQVIKKTVAVPYEVPPGRYIVNARAYTKDDELITCLTATVDFPPPS